MLACASCDDVQGVLIHGAPAMPPDLWWVTACILFLLALTALIDVFTAIVPDILVLLGILAVTGTQWFAVSADFAAAHLQQGLLAGLIVWVVNELWFRLRGHDALGMGDAKWTVLAVVCFGVMPALFAWGIGAILAVTFIASARIAHHRVTHLTFAPFLFVGLVCGIYWLRFAR